MKQKYLNRIPILTRCLYPIFKNIWWYSLVHEKNTCKSRASHNYIKQLKPESYNILQALLGVVKQYLKFVLRKIYFFNLNPLYINPKNIIVDYPTKFLKSIYSDDSVKIYFPQRNQRKLSRQLLSQDRTHLIDDFIRLVDFFIVPFKAVKNIALHLSNRLYIRRSSSTLYPYIRKEILRSFTGDILIDGLFYEAAFKNLRNQYSEVEKIVYPYEGLSWEKALCVAFKDKRKIGVSCSTPGHNIFNYWYSNYEMKIMPRPDKLGVMGQQAYLDFNRMFGKDVFILGAIRYNQLKTFPNIKREKCEFEWTFVILNSNDEQNRELIQWCKEEGLNCLYKLHPQNNKKDYTDIPLTNGEYSMSMAKQAIVFESSMALEAYLLGVPVVVPELPSFIDLSPLQKQYRNVSPSKEERKWFLNNEFTFRTDKEMRRLIDEI